MSEIKCEKCGFPNNPETDDAMRYCKAYGTYDSAETIS
jgi:hypothetical protein